MMGVSVRELWVTMIISHALVVPIVNIRTYRKINQHRTEKPDISVTYMHHEVLHLRSIKPQT